MHAFTLLLTVFYLDNEMNKTVTEKVVQLYLWAVPNHVLTNIYVTPAFTYDEIWLGNCHYSVLTFKLLPIGSCHRV